MITIIASVFFVISWYLFWSPSFTVTEIRISGASADTETALREVVNARLAERRYLVYPQRSIFMLDKTALIAAINEKFLFDGMEIRKKLPHSLVIDVIEKPIAAVTMSDNRFLALDAAGTVIRELTSQESFALADLPDSLDSALTDELGAESVDLMEIAPATEVDPAEIKRNRNPHPVLFEKVAAEGTHRMPGDTAVSAAALATALEAYARLPDLSGSGVSWFVVDAAAESVEVVLREGWSVHLSTAIPFEVRGERLGLVLREKVGPRKQELEYVDLRYDERIFFRFKDGATE